MYVWRVGREARARRRAGASMGCVRRESRERIQCTRGTQLAAGGPGGKVGRSVASVDGPPPRAERLRAHECHTQLPKKAVEFTPPLEFTHVCAFRAVFAALGLPAAGAAKGGDDGRGREPEAQPLIGKAHAEPRVIGRRTRLKSHS